MANIHSPQVEVGEEPGKWSVKEVIEWLGSLEYDKDKELLDLFIGV